MSDKSPEKGAWWNSGVRLRELVRQVCSQHEVVMMKGHVVSDQGHLTVSIPPQVVRGSVYVMNQWTQRI